MKKVHVFSMLFVFTGILIGFSSCQKDQTTTEDTELNSTITDELLDTYPSNATNTSVNASVVQNTSYTDNGSVFVMSNAADDNKILVYSRAANGLLTSAGRFSTGGKGTGGGLGSQNALMRYGNFLFACNAGSNDFTVFKIRGTYLTRLLTMPSNGTRPISITAYRDLVYVLNAGGTGNISGYRWQENGRLKSLMGSLRPLSTNASGPAQIEFNPAGTVLVVTEKATNIISTYEVGNNGVASEGSAQASVGMTPFGFAFTAYGRLIVSNAAGGAANLSSLSSYNVSNWGKLNVISEKVADKQSAACWVLVSKDNRFCYTTNTGSNNISGYRVSSNGALSLLDTDGITATTGAGPIDFIFSANGRYLYTLNGAGRSVSIHQIKCFIGV
jgi:6-phosphogluconolactonase